MSDPTAIKPEVLARFNSYIAGADTEISEEAQSLRQRAEAGDTAALAELNDAFGSELDFGTGGLRGIMGPGTNRMNRVIIAKATQGLAQYVASQVEAGSVAIAYDSRNNSAAFARVAAQVIAGNGLRAYLFEDLRPTPELSFAVRELGATAGIVVTASHNPKEYSGYKVSWSDGAQVLPPHDSAIIEQVRSVQSLEQVRTMDFDKAVAEGHIVMLGAEMDRAYLDALQRVRLLPELTNSRGGELKIVYTSLHGTGIRVLPQAFDEWGFSSVQIVEDQADPNGDFPTVQSPNPEEHAALEAALDLARQTDADIVFGTDPDTDRLGYAVKHKGEWQLISGNQGCALLTWYMCEILREQNRMPDNAAIVTTIVTTGMIHDITTEYGVHFGECLTGFKHIASLMREYEQPGPDGLPQKQFLMGCEESYGYLVGTHARDKDAVVAACSTAEMALWAKTQGMTLVDLLMDLYRRYGVHVESQISLTRPGLAGMQEIKDMMNNLRENPPTEIAGIAVQQFTDIKDNTSRNLIENTTAPGPGLPSSNVLIFDLADGSTVVARPSGTEPKIKFYFMVVDKEGIPLSAEELPSQLARCEEKDAKLRQAWLKIVGEEK